jgi:peptidoglycan/LPS O-acetylase OafA/YrhL
MSHAKARSVAPLLAAAAALAVFAATMWFAWLGWDDEYYLVDGVAQGPYRAWQVVGCGLSICLAAVVALAWARRGAVLLAAAATVGFAIPWGVHAGSTDETGLWVVGLMMLLGGSFVGLVVVLTVCQLVLRRVLSSRSWATNRPPARR